MDRSRADRILEELDMVARNSRRPEVPSRSLATRTAVPFGLVAVAAVVVLAIVTLGPRFAAVGPAATPSSSAAIVGPVESTPTPEETLTPQATPTPEATPVTSPVPTPAEITPAPSPAPETQTPQPTASPAPAPTPTASPVPPAGFVCSATYHLDRTAPGYTPVQLTDVRVGTHAGYDRIVFEFAGTGIPSFDLSSVSPPFVYDGSGQPVHVDGSAFLKFRLFSATGSGTYSGPASFSPGYPTLTSLVRTGDYEGYVTWIAGMTANACYKVSVMSGPTRIVIDVAAP